ncbi:co-chaperone GrpE [Brevibacterium mcbrellneri ATCC 49030]|uniref:Protein GrpE n=1 Tax=Brevibacterium mcbrellneri ATCC 49030 TaxID=585530 RepID=D4YQT2_9MICO|nr:nucleotide exchange factor GrpE [Brevibacterium mcbrellneri]EFG46445.1 co-chaperone GrpE [Brevibacterium mcbrellneri ATCC 49030]
MSTEKPFDSAGEPAEQGFSFTDKRRVDPETGEVRAPKDAQQPAAGEQDAGETAAAEAGAEPTEAGQSATGEPAADASDLGVEIPEDASALGDSEAGEVSADAAQHLEDLQRLNAEYAAYRRRSERERERAHENGMVKVTEALMPILDEVRLAREAGDVEGPFAKHVDRLFEALNKLGIEQYGEVGEVFDPNVHEALMQQPSEEVEEPTVFLVMQPGYRMGERILKAARVGVHVPAE